MLYRGLKHHVLPRSVQAGNLKTSIERLVNRVIYDKTRASTTSSVEEQAESHSSRSVSIGEETFQNKMSQTAQEIVTCDFRKNAKFAE